MRKLRYATKSEYKREEILALREWILPAVGGRPNTKVGELFEFEFDDVILEEPLERDLEQMVRHKAKSAYRALLAPVIVEHAGIILEKYESQNFPGGLTQPMWDALDKGDKGETFVHSLEWAGLRAIARAYVGYCDGQSIRTFIGETRGILVPKPRGGRDFYWDTVFSPDTAKGETYSELAGRGLLIKIGHSQTTKAMSGLFNFLLSNPSALFADP